MKRHFKTLLSKRDTSLGMRDQTVRLTFVPSMTMDHLNSHKLNSQQLFITLLYLPNPKNNVKYLTINTDKILKPLKNMFKHACLPGVLGDIQIIILKKAKQTL